MSVGSMTDSERREKMRRVRCVDQQADIRYHPNLWPVCLDEGECTANDIQCNNYGLDDGGGRLSSLSFDQG